LHLWVEVKKIGKVSPIKTFQISVILLNKILKQVGKDLKNKSLLRSVKALLERKLRNSCGLAKIIFAVQFFN
jgi:predicted transcriptional regulator